MLASVYADFDATSRREGTRALVQLTGELDCVNEGLARAEVEIALERGGTELVIDLSRVTFMDARGVHVLLDARSACVALHRRLLLVPAPQRVMRILELCSVHGCFRLLDSGDDRAQVAA
jgi:anti-anti-sigma factor